ncbi:unnamed protein product [Peronospora belbahrii]|uniref:No apical meristem-associated C-terminal domain-containing protein n=1 Tax=Peronospora belbahrii TaxID=622444 RepID=A0AAU9LPP7_9STRA|nr:unnamed protein product [Peronospora belbahrii]
MHVRKKTMPKADRRRLAASDSKSDADRKIQTVKSANKSSRKEEGNALNEALEPLIKAPSDEAEFQLLAIQTDQLEFKVAQWKQQQMLRRDALQLKSEEIKLKEMITKQQQHTQVMELKAGIFKALDEANQSSAQAKKYLALLEG